MSIPRINFFNLNFAFPDLSFNSENIFFSGIDYFLSPSIEEAAIGFLENPRNSKVYKICHKAFNEAQKKYAESALYNKVFDTIHSFFKEFMFFIDSFRNDSFDFLDPFCDNSSDDHRENPIILVHGYMSSPGTFNLMKKNLESSGHRNVYLISLEKNKIAAFGNIHTYADLLAKRIEDISQKNGNKPTSVVAHSMGGLVATLAMRILGDKKDNLEVKFNHFVTIGSPLNGTIIADIANFILRGSDNSLEQMCRYSEITKTAISYINTGLTLQNTNVLHIGGREDFVVPQASSLPADSPHKKSIIERCGHLGLLKSPDVMSQILSHLSL
jgi:pimeloyl-ACP methyl ester carboxylesterase